MEDKAARIPTDKNENVRSDEVTRSERRPMDAAGITKQGTRSAENDVQFYMIDPISEKSVTQKEEPNNYEGEINMEATINSDDVIRAGGFGARDDLSSFLPVASDSTDFEASLLGARDYEEPQGERHRPGLGWSEDKKSD